MNNVLVVQVVEVKVLGDDTPRYGFIAKDNDCALYNINFPSLKAFKKEYPSIRSMLMAIFQSKEFYQCAKYVLNSIEYIDISGLIVNGYPEDEHPLCINERAMEHILKRNGHEFRISDVRMLNRVDSDSYVYHIEFFDDAHNTSQCTRVKLDFNSGKDIVVQL